MMVLRNAQKCLSWGGDGFISSILLLRLPLCPRRLVLRQRSSSELAGADDLRNISLGRAYCSSDWYLADGLFVSLAAEELLVLLLGLDEGLLEEVGVCDQLAHVSAAMLG